MALKNYTTNVDAVTTISKIHVMLANHGARRIMFDYAQDGKVSAVCFTIQTPEGERGIKLPANSARVQKVLHRQKVDPKSRNRSSIDDSPEQAERVAWRIVYDWLDAQLAILETEMVDLEQVFLPYFINAAGQTLYEAYQQGRIALPE